MNQSFAKVFGPEPSKACLEPDRVALATERVVESEGRTSLLETLKAPETTLPIVPLDEEITGLIVNKIETTNRSPDCLCVCIP